jgi:hypothetical protein
MIPSRQLSVVRCLRLDDLAADGAPFVFGQASPCRRQRRAAAPSPGIAPVRGSPRISLWPCRSPARRARPCHRGRKSRDRRGGTRHPHASTRHRLCRSLFLHYAAVGSRYPHSPGATPGRARGTPRAHPRASHGQGQEVSRPGTPGGASPERRQRAGAEDTTSLRLASGWDRWAGQRLGWEIEELAEELAELFGHRVDLVSLRALHPMLKPSVLAEARPVYAA